MTNEEDYFQVGKTIVQQLGGNRFVMMTGAKFLFLSDSVSIKLTIGSMKSVDVRLEADDTYTVFGVSRKKSIKPTLLNGIYAEDLAKVFTSITGLDTHL
jgi:hypothetical protein